jgi:hypothetical protein
MVKHLLHIPFISNIQNNHANHGVFTQKYAIRVDYTSISGDFNVKIGENRQF